MPLVLSQEFSCSFPGGNTCTALRPVVCNLIHFYPSGVRIKRHTLDLSSPVAHSEDVG